MADLSDIYEKLGVFYLGRGYDPGRRELTGELTLYDSRDLVTHAVCVGMTGSGKTGLGVTLLEEAAIDGIPALVIDPKGDLTNLLLNFPHLRPEDFRPWVNADDANRQGITVDDLAAKQAELWKTGIADWYQSGDRISRLGQACDFNIFTPGSDAGIPVSILSSFAAPPPAVLEDGDLLRDRIVTTATSLLTLLGIDADPIRSREHILLTTIFDHCWRKQRDLDLGGLIQSVQNPPVQQIGVMDLESFFSSKDRFELAMSLNNLLAAPGFSSWLSGEPLDVDRLLHTATGKPRISIFYIAHLSESERMFFTSLLLNQTIGWMRGCSGTSSLRAMLYIDEIFGYMPPVSEPPTKKPLLTLLKQARAYGLGLVLATQNPVDLDYKGLSNAGTWFLGRLQTERDKQRVLDGLEGASTEAGASFDRGEISDILSGVGKRVFLMHNVHEAAPVTFQTRWALSYLAGPMTRTQIKQLMASKKTAMTAASQLSETPEPNSAHAPLPASGAPRTPIAQPTTTNLPPSLSPDVHQVLLPLRRSPGGAVMYEPRLLAVGKVHFVDTRKGLSADRRLSLLADLDAGALGIDWGQAVELDIDENELVDAAEVPGEFGQPPPEATKAKSYADWTKKLADHLYRTASYPLFRCKALQEYSEPGESEREFRIRLSERAREERDDSIEAFRKKYANRLASAEERVRKAELRVEREAQEASGAKMQSVISFGATILGAVLGRRRLGSTTVGRAATTARGVERASKQADDVKRAQADVDAYEEKLEELREELEHEIQAIADRYDVGRLELDKLRLKPRKSDIDIRHVVLAWAPFGRDAAGGKIPLFR